MTGCFSAGTTAVVLLLAQDPDDTEKGAQQAPDPVQAVQQAPDPVQAAQQAPNKRLQVRYDRQLH